MSYSSLTPSTLVPIFSGAAPTLSKTNKPPLAPRPQVASTLLWQPLTPPQKDAAIGLFDSGLGGLSVYRHLKKVLPNERYIYYADTLHVPYGNRSSASIIELTLSAVRWLVAMGCKLIVIACNSASAHALSIVRHHYPQIPIVGLVPALKPAVLQSQTRRVAVLATKATIEGALLNQVIADYATPNQVAVIKRFDPSLVPWVEQGMPKDSATAAQLLAMLHEFAKQQVDYLVLGCTHYPFFRDFLTSEIAAHDMGIRVIDSGAAIADRVMHILRTQNMLLEATKPSAVPAVPQAHSSTRLKVSDAIHSHKPLPSLCAPANLVVDDLYVNSITNLDAKTQDRCAASASHHPAKLCFYATDCQKDIQATEHLVRQLVNIPLTN